MMIALKVAVPVHFSFIYTRFLHCAPAATFPMFKQQQPALRPGHL